MQTQKNIKKEYNKPKRLVNFLGILKVKNKKFSQIKINYKKILWINNTEIKNIKNIFEKINNTTKISCTFT